MDAPRDRSALFVLFASVPTTLYAGFGLQWLSVPWLPIALIGTAVAFMTGFKNNASYGRMWEALTILGGLVNASPVQAEPSACCGAARAALAKLVRGELVHGEVLDEQLVYREELLSEL